MATTVRQIDSRIAEQSLAQALAEEPFRFQFFQAVRLMQQFAPEGVVGRFASPSNEVIRFSARQSLEFPASELQEIIYPCSFCASTFAAESELEQHLEKCPERKGRHVPRRPPRLTMNFMGLTGPQGVLPICYTEFVIERSHKKDTGLADFLDIFNHRAVSLFYQSWEKYRFPVRYERHEGEHLSRNLADLIGIGSAGLKSRLEPAVSDESLLYYTGLLSQQPHSAIGLEQMLADYFEVPVQVVQFVGRWYRLNPQDCTLLSQSNSACDRLGSGAVVGDEVWDQQSLVRIRLGPLSLKRYLEFLPQGASHKSLREIVRLYSGGQLDFEVQLTLRDDETPPCALGVEEPSGPRLGWLTWVKSAPLGVYTGGTTIRL